MGRRGRGVGTGKENGHTVFAFDGDDVGDLLGVKEGGDAGHKIFAKG